MNIKKLQKAVGVHEDGIIGRGTLTAVFRKLGANQSRAEELALAANVHFRTYGILDNPLRLIHFLAQLAQGFVMLMFAVFGLLAIGIVYQSIALMHGKSLAEVIAEVKAAFVAIISGKGGE